MGKLTAGFVMGVAVLAAVLWLSGHQPESRMAQAQSANLEDRIGALEFKVAAVTDFINDTLAPFISTEMVRMQQDLAGQGRRVDTNETAVNKLWKCVFGVGGLVESIGSKPFLWPSPVCTP